MISFWHIVEDNTLPDIISQHMENDTSKIFVDQVSLNVLNLISIWYNLWADSLMQYVIEPALCSLGYTCVHKFSLYLIPLHSIWLDIRLWRKYIELCIDCWTNLKISRCFNDPRYIGVLMISTIELNMVYSFDINPFNIVKNICQKIILSIAYFTNVAVI